MSLQIVELPTHVSTVKSQVVQDLEDLLARALKGEFEGFAWVASLPNGDCKTGYTKSVDFHTVLSGVTILQHRMIANRQSVEGP
jgi:hypothetical protein